MILMVGAQVVVYDRRCGKDMDETLKQLQASGQEKSVLFVLVPASQAEIRQTKEAHA